MVMVVVDVSVFGSRLHAAAAAAEVGERDSISEFSVSGTRVSPLDKSCRRSGESLISPAVSRVSILLSIERWNVGDDILANERLTMPFRDS